MWRTGYYSADLGDFGKKNTINIDGKEPVLFYIPSNIEHAVINTSNNVIYLLAFRDIKDDETIRSESLLD